MKVIRQVVLLGYIIRNLGGYPVDYLAGYQIFWVIIQGTVLSITIWWIIRWIIFKKCMK